MMGFPALGFRGLARIKDSMPHHSGYFWSVRALGARIVVTSHWGDNKRERNHGLRLGVAPMNFESVEREVLSFRDERDWTQFHNPKDLAISISIEASELLELFQWSGADLERQDKRGQIGEELADVMIYCMYLANSLGTDVPTLISKKLEEDKRKYPVEKAKGTARKYTEL